MWLSDQITSYPLLAGFLLGVGYLVAGLMIILMLESGPRCRQGVRRVAGEAPLRALTAWLLWPGAVLLMLALSLPRRVDPSEGLF